jgi:hypothetical protein
VYHLLPQELEVVRLVFSKLNQGSANSATTTLPCAASLTFRIGILLRSSHVLEGMLFTKIMVILTVIQFTNGCQEYHTITKIMLTTMVITACQVRSAKGASTYMRVSATATVNGPT